MSIELSGKVMGSVRTHTEETLKKVFDKAYTVIQLSKTELYEGELDQLKGEIPKRPIVLFIRTQRYRRSDAHCLPSPDRDR